VLLGCNPLSPRGPEVRFEAAGNFMSGVALLKAAHLKPDPINGPMSIDSVIREGGELARHSGSTVALVLAPGC
jgi:hypothetical protein